MALRPEAVTIESTDEQLRESGYLIRLPAMIEQIIYHGFATHLHLRMPNGEPLIAFEQNRASQ